MDALPAPATPAPFDLTGGDLCLDFANTWGDRNRPGTDDLTSYGRLLDFARQTGLLAPGAAEALAARAQAGPMEAEAALDAARILREALYGLFSARAHGLALPAGDLALLNRALQKALPHLGLACEAGAPVAWHWRDGAQDLAFPLWPITRAAAELLTREPSVQIRECGGSQCTWLFLDHSRGGSRRWCSMTSCGNREKARRHYQRTRKPHSGSASTSA